MSDAAGSPGESVPLWLITFTDVMALMLTFFVLLYSMSTPQEEKWEAISDALTYRQGAFDGAALNAGSQDVISIDTTDTKRALAPGYVKTVLSMALVQKSIEDVLLVVHDNILLISLPSDILFESGSARMGADGQKILFEVGGVLSRLGNRVEVIGHTDPRPLTGAKGPYKTNWALSLARAVSVSRALKDVGYEQPLTVRGLASARFADLPESLPIERRYALARRVDILVMRDSGYRKDAFDVLR